MKKLLFILLLLTEVVQAQIYTDNQCVTVSKLSIDPRSPIYCMYFNNILDVESTKIYKSDITKIFTKYDNVDYLDNIWFSAHPTYYKLWDVDDSLLFTVKLPKNTHEILGNHLLLFLNTLRDYNEKYRNK